MQGEINPNEIVTMNCIFIPSSIKNWTIRIPCYYSCDLNGKKKKTINIFNLNKINNIFLL